MKNNQNNQNEDRQILSSEKEEVFGEEIELTDEDEEVLDNAWEQLRKEMGGSKK